MQAGCGVGSSVTALAICVLAFWTILLALAMPFLLNQDSWLALVDGRLIAQHGLPHTDTLTVWTLGRHWIDQQWASHLVLYEAATLERARCGDPDRDRLRHRRARPRRRRRPASRRFSRQRRARGEPPVLATPWLAEVRSQSFALIPFVVVYALLASESSAAEPTGALRRACAGVLGELPRLGQPRRRGRRALRADSCVPARPASVGALSPRPLRSACSSRLTGSGLVSYYRLMLSIRRSPGTSRNGSRPPCRGRRSSSSSRPSRPRPCGAPAAGR